MSPFGIIMFFITIIWTLIVFGMIASSPDMQAFIRSTNFLWAIVGYVVIIVFTVTVRRIVRASMR